MEVKVGPDELSDITSTSLTRARFTKKTSFSVDRRFDEGHSVLILLRKYPHVTYLDSLNALLSVLLSLR